MINQVVNFDVEQSLQKRITIERLAPKVSKRLGSNRTISYLRAINEAPNENLQIEQSVVLTEALWQMNKWNIFLYSLIFLTQYALIVVYICIGLGREALSIAVGVVSFLMICLELRQMRKDP